MNNEKTESVKFRMLHVELL